MERVIQRACSALPDGDCLCARAVGVGGAGGGGTTGGGDCHLASADLWDKVTAPATGSIRRRCHNHGLRCTADGFWRSTETSLCPLPQTRPWTFPEACLTISTICFCQLRNSTCCSSQLHPPPPSPSLARLCYIIVMTCSL